LHAGTAPGSGLIVHASGIVGIGTTVTSGAVAGDLVIANAKSLKFVNPAGTGAGYGYSADANGILRLRNSREITLANTATIAIDTQGGMVFIGNTVDHSALFVYSADASPVVVEVADPEGTYSITQGTASSSNVYFSGTYLTLENNTGASRIYSIFNLAGS